MNSQICKSSKRERLASIIVHDRPHQADQADQAGRPERFSRSLLIPTPRRVCAVPGGINNQMVGIAIAAVMAIVGGAIYVGFLSSAHSSASQSTLSSANTTAKSIYVQEDGFVALPGLTTFGASLTSMLPSLTFVGAGTPTSAANSVQYAVGTGGGTTGQTQSAEFVTYDGNGHCMFSLIIGSASSALVTGTKPAGVTGPGTYYAAAPASAGACSIATEGALPTAAAYPSSGAAMAAWQAVPIAS